MSVHNNQQSRPRWEEHQQGLAVAGAVAIAASVSLAVLSETEILGDVLPSSLLEKLLREEEGPAAAPLRRIEEVGDAVR